ncbi:hypothetical protein [Roseivivax isoporae]|uniref:Lysozyme inhibitor LprI N-terminal domain-containing protein n=1 Tax=Roseivivax isoporae LMG 25204 TaxID=1449351 RepID=X7F8Q9_9RHOB|nr:hypothetical protein [Roseivivax isoporae]ETX29292.1 hypothetical protein RISW2_02125 [Roseivivax isoporae LMG 25204]
MTPRAATLAPAALLLHLLPAAASVEGNAAAECAALWTGYARYAEASAYLDGAKAAREDAAAWRAKAIAETGDTAGVDAYIAAEAPGRALMFDAYVVGGDETTRNILERALTRCGDG